MTHAQIKGFRGRRNDVVEMYNSGAGKIPIWFRDESALAGEDTSVALTVGQGVQSRTRTSLVRLGRIHIRVCIIRDQTKSRDVRERIGVARRSFRGRSGVRESCRARAGDQQGNIGDGKAETHSKLGEEEWVRKERRVRKERKKIQVHSGPLFGLALRTRLVGSRSDCTLPATFQPGERLKSV